MYKKEKKNWLKHLDFTILDIISLQLAFIVAYVFRLGWSLPYSSEPYERLAVVLFLIRGSVPAFCGDDKHRPPEAVFVLRYVKADG